MGGHSLYMQPILSQHHSLHGIFSDSNKKASTCSSWGLHILWHSFGNMVPLHTPSGRPFAFSHLMPWEWSPLSLPSKIWQFRVLKAKLYTLCQGEKCAIAMYEACCPFLKCNYFELSENEVVTTGVNRWPFMMCILPVQAQNFVWEKQIMHKARIPLVEVWHSI